MQKVKMLKTVLGVKKGLIHPDKFEKDQIYTIDDSLFIQFNILKVVEKVEAEEVKTEEVEAEEVKTEEVKAEEVEAEEVKIKMEDKEEIKPEKAVIKTVEEKQKKKYKSKRGGKK